MLKPLEGKAALSVAQATGSFNAWEGSVRSGKTVSSTIAWLSFVLSAPPGHLMMVGKTTRTIKENVISDIITYLGPQNVRFAEGSGNLFICGRRIEVVGANDETAADRIRGRTLVGAYVDEAAVLPESFFDMLVSRLSVEGARLFMTMNPDGPKHWMKRRFLDKASYHLDHDGSITQRASDGDKVLDLKRFTLTLRDNPHNSAQYIKQVEQMYDGVFYERNILGQWAAAEGLVYHMFRDQRHVVDTSDLPQMASLLGIGVDYGTSNPTSAVLLGLGIDGCLYALDEWRHDASLPGAKPKTDAEISRDLSVWYSNILNQYGNADQAPKFYLDPSAASLKVQMRRDGLPMHPAHNKVLAGIGVVHAAFAVDRLKIHAVCEGILEEVQLYRWDAKATERGEDKPLKENDHSMDALRYAVKSTQYKWMKHIPISLLDEASEGEES